MMKPKADLGRALALLATVTAGGLAWADGGGAGGGAVDPDRPAAHAPPPNPASEPQAGRQPAGANVPDHSAAQRNHDRRHSPGGGYDTAGTGANEGQTPGAKR